MTIEINSVTIKVKKGQLTISSGLVIEDKICKMPIALIPNIKWDKDVEVAIISALIDAKEYDTVMAMKKADDAKDAKDDKKEETIFKN